jgi:hypothetical protein
VTDDSQTIDPRFVATERLLVEELGATDLVVRQLDDGIDPSPLWIAQAMWQVPARVRFDPWRCWGVGETETDSVIALADTILQYRLCPYCGQRTWLCSVESEELDLSPEEVHAMLAEDAERRLGKPVELECRYDWDSAEARFTLSCAEGGV